MELDLDYEGVSRKATMESDGNRLFKDEYGDWFY